MFTEFVRIGCSFPACLIFHQPSTTLDHLETVLLCVSTSYHRHFTSCPVTVLSGRTCHPVMVQYLDITLYQAIEQSRL